MQGVMRLAKQRFRIDRRLAGYPKVTKPRDFKHISIAKPKRVESPTGRLSNVMSPNLQY